MSAAQFDLALLNMAPGHPVCTGDSIAWVSLDHIFEQRADAWTGRAMVS